jgi:hypothetical protein
MCQSEFQGSHGVQAHKHFCVASLGADAELLKEGCQALSPGLARAVRDAARL